MSADDSRNRIKILPDHLVDVIAAGEVVERPASVVKELVENSLDAGARRIEVRIEDGGKRKITVLDDGSGMDEDDCLMAIERHATSKIASLDDLQHIRTLGFRGEAIPSIASVGRFTLQSFDGRADSGTRIIMDGGRLVSVEPVGRARGTTITLEGIFRKLPARRKYLRSRETEAAWCLGTVEDASLACQDVSFTVLSNGVTVLDLPGAGSLAGRVASLWGADTAGSMMALSGTIEGMRVEGLISPPTVTFSRRTRHKVIINGRPVRDPVLNRVISSALAGSWPSGRFPALVLILDVEDDLVDVNVHPAKREVRLRRTDHIVELMRRAIRGIRDPVMAGAGIKPGSGKSRDYPVHGSPKTPVSERHEGLPEDPEPGSPTAARETFLPFEPSYAGRTGERDGKNHAARTESEDESDGRTEILGQVLGTYILLESDQGIQIIDQHAAHERIVFNRLMEAREGYGPPMQRLAVPIVMDLSPSESANLMSAARLLDSFGFEVDQFGPSSLRVTAVPSDLKGTLVEELLRALASDPDAFGREPESVALAVSRWACRQSIMAGRKLSKEQITQLVRDLDVAESGFSCPHGRPTRVTMGFQELERLFGRR
jgi:DNA mismatch repair protein MutL